MPGTNSLALVVATFVLSSCYSLHSNRDVGLDDAAAASDGGASDGRSATGIDTAMCPNFPAPDFSVSEGINTFAIGPITESNNGCAAGLGMHVDDLFELHSNWDGEHISGAVLRLPDGRTLLGSNSAGDVQFCGVTEYEGADGCRWSRRERVSGLGMLQYTSSEVVVLGEFCERPCTVSWNSR